MKRRDVKDNLRQSSVHGMGLRNPAPRTRQNTTPSFGLCCLAAVVREKGHEARIVEAGRFRLTLKETLASILKQRPDIVGFRASTVSLNNAALLAKAIKEYDAKVVTILGGPHVTAEPSATLSRFLNLTLPLLAKASKPLLNCWTLSRPRGFRRMKG